MRYKFAVDEGGHVQIGSSLAAQAVQTPETAGVSVGGGGSVGRVVGSGACGVSVGGGGGSGVSVGRGGCGVSVGGGGGAGVVGIGVLVDRIGDATGVFVVVLLDDGVGNANTVVGELVGDGVAGNELGLGVIGVAVKATSAEAVGEAATGIGDAVTAEELGVRGSARTAGVLVVSDKGVVSAEFDWK